MRVVPRANEAINETWISDRDRFSYEGIYSDDRLPSPLVKTTANGARSTGRPRSKRRRGCLAKADQPTSTAPGRSASLVAPSATLEEGYLLARIARGLGSDNIDHRLRQRDFRDQARDPVYPWLGMQRSPSSSSSDGVLVVGSNLRKEAPMLAHRVRKAALWRGAKVAFVNPRATNTCFRSRAPISRRRTALVEMLAACWSRRRARHRAARARWQRRMLRGRRIAHAPSRSRRARCSRASARLILLGALAQRHPHFAALRALAARAGGADRRDARLSAGRRQCASARRSPACVAASRRGGGTSPSRGRQACRDARCADPRRLRAAVRHRARARLRRRCRARARRLGALRPCVVCR